MTPALPGEDARDRGPIALMARHRVGANLLMIVALVGGLMMTSRIKQEVFPEFELDMVLINVAYPGASPAEVEQGVLLAIEEAVRGLDGVEEVRSTALEGVGVVTVELALGTDADRALADVKSAVDRVASLPADAERPIIGLAARRREVVSLIVHGDIEEKALRALADSLRDELLADPRITLVELGAVRPLEIAIEVPGDELRRHGLTLDQVAAAVRRASVELPGGTVKTEAGEVLLRTSERRDLGREFEEVVLAARPDGTALRVRDLGRVTDGFRETDQEATFDGRPAAMIKVFRVGEQTPIEVSDAVHELIERRRATLPPGVGLAVWSDTSELYRDRIDLLMRNARLGLCLVLLTLGLFLEARLAFWVAMGIPTSVLGALLFLPAADVSINMISLFAFILTLGIVVDDAIVVGEAVYLHRRKGLTPLQAAVAGTREVAVPVVFAVVTNMVAFIPLLFVPGFMGKFFRVIPIVVCAVFAISLLESLFVLPAHLAHTPPAGTRGWQGWLHARQQGFSGALERFVARAYVPLLDRVLGRRYLALAAAAALLLATSGVVAGGHIAFTFMPRIDSDAVNADLAMPFGASIEDTRRAQRRLLRAALDELEARGGKEHVSRGVFAQVGGSGLTSTRAVRGGAGSSGGHLAEVAVYLAPGDRRDFSAGEFARAWRKRAGDIPGVDTLAFKSTTGPGQDAPIAVELSHPDEDRLRAAADRVAAALRGYRGVTDIDDGFQPGKEQLDLRLRPGARALGVSESDLGRQVRAAFFGVEATRAQRGRDEVRAYVRLPRAERESEHFVERMVVRAPGGGEIPLAQAAEASRGRSYTEIKRRDGRRVVTATADVVPGVANANEVLADLGRTAIPAIAAEFPELRWSFEGQRREQTRALSALGRGAVMALLVIFAMLAMEFRSYLQPVIVMLAIPFGLVGALLGHLALGYDLSLMSMMGVVALTGVVINDSLVFVDATNARRGRGLAVRQALLAAGQRRFRAILLTSLTTFFGLMPMILETSVQARFLVPMAISLGCGVMFATFITLLIVPACYLAVEDATSLAARALALWRGAPPGTGSPRGAHAPDAASEPHPADAPHRAREPAGAE